MTDQQTHHDFQPNRQRDADLSQKLEAVGWALFLIWVGFAFLADIGWGWGLLGVAVIIFGEAAVRWNQGLNIGGFWIIAGLMFLTGALWELFQVPWPLAPIMIIFCGLAILWGAMSGRQLMKK